MSLVSTFRLRVTLGGAQHRRALTQCPQNGGEILCLHESIVKMQSFSWYSRAWYFAYGRNQSDTGFRDRLKHESPKSAHSSRWLSSESFRNERRSLCASTKPLGITAANVTSQSNIPQLAAISGGTSNTLDRVVMVAICDPPPTAGSCSIEPSILAKIRISSCETGISSASMP